MKKFLLLALTVFASATHANAELRTGAPQDAIASSMDSPEIKGDLHLQPDTVHANAVPSGATKTPGQILCEVSMSANGKLLKSFTILTNDGKEANASSEEIIPHQVSCAADSGCTPGTVRSGVFLSLTPQIESDGSIRTACALNLSAVQHADDFAATDTFYLSRGQSMTFSYPQLTVTIRARLV